MPSESVMVVGIGGRGHLGLQYSRVFGSTTVAVDVREEELQLATDLPWSWTSEPRYGAGTGVWPSVGRARRGSGDQDRCGSSLPMTWVAIPLRRFQTVSIPSARTGRMIMVQNAFRSLL
jgi:hypothetical protein